MKRLVAIGWLSLLAVSVGAIFWNTELKYSLPTPVPAGYRPVENGTVIHQDLLVSNKPKLFHFFNPSCPCSRFNMRYFKSLVKNYGNQVDFAVVLVNSKAYTPNEIREKYELDIPVVEDMGLAKECGVYSTPQAAIIDANGKLAYRGNYNRSRYCTDQKTNYAEQALTALLLHQVNKKFDLFATRSYGCELPNCTKP